MMPRLWEDLDDGDGVNGGRLGGVGKVWFGDVGVLEIFMEGGFSMDFTETEHALTLFLGAVSSVSAVSGYLWWRGVSGQGEVGRDCLRSLLGRSCHLCLFCWAVLGLS